MCGIAGIISQNRHHVQLVSAMINALKHRGPDGQGLLSFEQCTLGHARLSIVDIAGGQQPMTNHDKTVAVSFNGEIYGYRDLRRQIDYPYKTDSDTEVLLAAYNVFGKDCVRHIKGMFAFAIWDEKSQTLLMARDRFGEKPLYYARGNNGEFIFASEIKAILATGLVDRSINEQALLHYLQYLTTPVGSTIYRHVHELPPAHQMIWQDGNLSIKRYWSLPESTIKYTLDEAAEEFSVLFRRAVQNQMVADVEVGAFLSGGLDSSTVCIEAADYRPGLQTISYGFAGPHSELPYARAVASQLGTVHHELEDNGEIGELLLAMGDVFDEPFADSSNIPTYRICKFASERMKVVLSGDGADELLGGYSSWYRPLALKHEHPLLLSPSPMKEKLLSLLIKLLHHSGMGQVTMLNNAYRILSVDEGDGDVACHYRQRCYFSGDETQRLLGLSASRPVVTGNGLDAVLRADIQDYLPADILRKVDMASMANGLEVRAPFLDVDLASFLIALPVSLKFNSSKDKILLRKAYGGRWPTAITNRPKTGFGAPVHDWLARPDITAIKNTLLGNPQARIYHLLDRKAVQPYLERDNYQSWILLVLAIWAEKHA